jgi:hypothetical protein
MTPRVRNDSGHFHTNIELMIIVAIIAIVAAIVIPFLIPKRNAKAAACVEALLRDAGTCPTGEKPHVTAAADGVEARSCPEAAKHPAHGARLVRRTDGSWGLRQEFPAWNGASSRWETGSTAGTWRIWAGARGSR